MRGENKRPRRNSLSVFFFQIGLIARNKRITEETYAKIRRTKVMKLVTLQAAYFKEKPQKRR